MNAALLLALAAASVTGCPRRPMMVIPYEYRMIEVQYCQPVYIVPQQVYVVPQQIYVPQPVVVSPPVQPKVAPPAAKVPRLIGDWEIKNVVVNNKATPEMKGAILSFKQNELHQVVAGKREPAMDASYSIDWSASPPKIDMRLKRAEDTKLDIHGILKVDSDQVTICWAIQPGADRPADFDAASTTPTVLIHLQRSSK